MMVRQRMTLCLLFLLGFLWHTPMQAQQALQYPQVLQPMQSPQSLQPPAERSGERESETFLSKEEREKYIVHIPLSKKRKVSLPTNDTWQDWKHGRLQKPSHTEAYHILISSLVA